MIKSMKFKYSKLSENKIKTLMEFFISGATARTTAKITNTNRNSVIKIYHKFREILFFNVLKESPFFDGEIEVDESYFGGARKGKRGRGAAGKVPVFGLLKRKGKVYTQIISDAKTTTLLPIIRQRVKADSIVYTDCWLGYNALDVSEFKHKRINHSVIFANGKNHINGIENFWNQAKRHLRKFNGIPRKYFLLYLKECEFRFNYGDAKNQLKVLKKWTKIYIENVEKYTKLNKK